FEYQLLDGIVKDPVPHADTGFPGSSGQLVQQAAMFPRTPVESEPRAKGFIVGVGQPFGYALVAGKDQSDWGDARGIASCLARSIRCKKWIARVRIAWLGGRAMSWTQRLRFVAAIALGCVVLQPKTVVQRQIWLNLPAVLCEEIKGRGPHQLMLCR